MNLRDDEGVATVLACCVLAAIVMVTGGMLHVGSAVVARHTAQSAADLSALGGAGALDGGDESACEMSAVIAERMRTVLAECECRGGMYWSRYAHRCCCRASGSGMRRLTRVRVRSADRVDHGGQNLDRAVFVEWVVSVAALG
ncbi:Rv3654c family TadE-like protein [Rhodococcus sp. 3Y1]